MPAGEAKNTNLELLKSGQQYDSAAKTGCVYWDEAPKTPPGMLNWMHRDTIPEN